MIEFCFLSEPLPAAEAVSCHCRAAQLHSARPIARGAGSLALLPSDVSLEVVQTPAPNPAVPAAGSE